MVANSAFLAAIVLLAILFVLLDQLSFLVPYKRFIFHQYLWIIGTTVVVTYINLFAFFYALNRRIFLKDTGRKLAHVDRQLLTRDTIVRDLTDQMSQDR